jgi:hypothetical protein
MIVGDSPSVCIDVAAARRFLEALAPSEVSFTFQTFDDSAAKRPELARIAHGSLDSNIALLRKLSAGGAGVFVTANRTDLKGRRQSNVISVRALFIDLDGAPMPDFVKAGLLPHIVVQTSPLRFHVYWRVTGVELAAFTGLQKRLAAAFGGDPNVCDLSRVMRLPGFPHQKDPEAPLMVMYKENPILASYEAEDFVSKLDAIELSNPESPGSKLTAALVSGLGSPPDMKRGYPDGQRTIELTKRAGWCLGPGGNMSEADAIAACLAWNTHNTPPLAEEKIRSTVASIARREAGKRALITHADPIIKVEGGELSREADEAEQALIRAGFPIFVRAGALVTPIAERVLAAKDQTTIVARLRKVSVDALIDRLGRCAHFQRYDARAKKWLSIDPPERVAKIILAREGAGKFPPIAGLITTPTLRPDGTLLATSGYDPATRLYLALDPRLKLPRMSDAPSRVEAKEALELLKDLVSGFPFVSPVDRAVALSGIITGVVRGALPVAPMHVFRAHTAGTGKSYLVDVAATIATGRHCPVIAAGKTEEETEKRLGALLCDGVSLVSIDNVNGELGGDALAQMTERPLVRVRILGKSEAPEFECKAAIFATGNNLILVGDMVRRAVICTLDAGVERPELRQFDFDPIARVLANRGEYVAACLTIVRAYQGAGSPKVCRPIGSYGEWSDTVRAALIWLGEADPIESMETAREEDPDLAAIRELFDHLIKLVPECDARTTSQIIKLACDRPPNGFGFKFPEFRDLLLRVAGEGGAISGRRLGKWLSKIAGRVVGGHRIEVKKDHSHGNRFTLRPAPNGGAHIDGGLVGLGG